MMKTVKYATLAVTGLALGAGLTGCSFGPQHSGIASASTPAVGVATHRTALMAKKVSNALAKHQTAVAVQLAEQIVALAPNDASYRQLLGQSYLAAGRFQAAETSFDDALTLSPGNDRVALNLALTKIAQGKADSARQLLDENRSVINASDYGLAVALSGDIDGGVRALEAAARAPGADAKARQNLALSYAMANRWLEARKVASQDLSAEMIDARMTQWASFVRPAAAWDQVASLLGVKPSYDPGQPQALALVKQSNQPAYAVATPAPAAPVEPVRVAENSAMAPAFEVAASPAAQAPEVQMAQEASPAATSAFIEEHIVPAFKRQVAARAVRPMAKPAVKPAAKPAMLAPIIHASATPLKQQVVPVAKPSRVAAAAPVAKPAARPAKAVAAAFTPARGVESGKFVVQLGAYAVPSVMEAAWNKVATAHAGLSDYNPTKAKVKVKSATFFRLSVAGFTSREAADQVCTKVKSNGGACFVRASSGDAPMQWARNNSGLGGSKFASRR